MKFTNEDAHKELVARMTAKGEKLNLTERSFNEMLERLIPLCSNDETELGAFVECVLPLFATADANVRNDVSHGIKAYKEQNPVEIKKNDTKPLAKEPTDLEKRILALEEENSRVKKEMFVSEKKKELTSMLKKKGVKNQKWIDSLVSNITIDDSFDSEAKSNDYLALYNSMQSEIPEGTTPKDARGSKDSYIIESISKASEFAKSNALVG